jgi:hypothetical protein
MLVARAMTSRKARSIRRDDSPRASATSGIAEDSISGRNITMIAAMDTAPSTRMGSTSPVLTPNTSPNSSAYASCAYSVLQLTNRARPHRTLAGQPPQRGRRGRGGVAPAQAGDPDHHDVPGRGRRPRDRPRRARPGPRAGRPAVPPVPPQAAFSPAHGFRGKTFIPNGPDACHRDSSTRRRRSSAGSTGSGCTCRRAGCPRYSPGGRS